MIGNAIGLVRDFVALKKAKQNAEIQTHNRIAAQQAAGTLSDTVIEAAQLYSFKGANLLREECFLMVAIPIVVSTFAPEFVRQCVHNVIYAIPQPMLWLMGGIIATAFGIKMAKRFI